jgi:Phosphate-induced protein 1 conserved region
MHSRILILASVGFLSLALGLMSQADDKDIAPNGKGLYTLDHPDNGNGNGNAGGGGGSQPMVYHGGPVMLGTPNVYYIWYGNWSGNSAPTILTDFAKGISGSPYFNINSTYFSTAGQVSMFVNYGGSTVNSQTSSLSDAGVQAVVASALSSGHLGPPDTNGVYFVLTSADVNETSGFCTKYCGWHTHGSINGNDIKYSFVGNPDRCPSACEEQTIGPNGNAGADGMASIIAHELSETVTDPDLNAWYDRRGMENADKCAWTFGSNVQTLSSGANYNVTLSANKKYLIQQNWRNTSSPSPGCAMSYP